MFTVPFHYLWSWECTYSSSYHHHEPPSNVLTLELEAGYMFILIVPVFMPMHQMVFIERKYFLLNNFCAKYGSMGRRFTEPVHLSNEMHVNTDSALVNISLEWDTWFPWEGYIERVWSMSLFLSNENSDWWESTALWSYTMSRVSRRSQPLISQLSAIFVGADNNCQPSWILKILLKSELPVTSLPDFLLSKYIHRG